MRKMTDAELQAAIAARPKIKITKEYIESRIHKIDYIRPMTANDTLTICVITFDNGFDCTGQAAAAHPDNFDAEIGQQLSYRNAIANAWPLFGFLLCEALNNPTDIFDSLIQEINAHGIPSPDSSQSTTGT